jgi:hypothetical protein
MKIEKSENIVQISIISQDINSKNKARNLFYELINEIRPFKYSQSVPTSACFDSRQNEFIVSFEDGSIKRLTDLDSSPSISKNSSHNVRITSIAFDEKLDDMAYLRAKKSAAWNESSDEVIKKNI